MKCDSKAETLIGRDAVFLVGSSSSPREHLFSEKSWVCAPPSHAPSGQGSEPHPIAAFLGHICLPSSLPRTLRGEQGQEKSYAVLSKSTPF